MKGFSDWSNVESKYSNKKKQYSWELKLEKYYCKAHITLSNIEILIK